MTFRQFQPGTAEYEDAVRLREDILRKPLGLALTEADLAQDQGCFHLGGFEGTRLTAVLLLQPLDERTIKMRQVAVCREQQGKGVGSKLIAFAEEFARQRSDAIMIAHARVSALEFYRRLGYTVSNEEFTEVTIPHRLVTKTLPAIAD